jgi:hypothetical protein
MTKLDKEVQKRSQNGLLTTLNWTWLNRLLGKQIDSATRVEEAKTRFIQSIVVLEREKAVLDDIETILEMDADERKTEQIDAKIRRKKAQAELDKIDGIIDVTPQKKAEPSPDNAPPKDATHAGIMD